VRNYKEAIIVMLDAGYSYNEIVQALGCTKSTISFHARRTGRLRASTPIPWEEHDWEEIQKYYNAGHSHEECMHYFHVGDRAWAKAKAAGKIQTKNHRFTIDEMLTEKSPYARPHIRARLLNNSILKQECSICGISEWLGKPLSFDLDHINGISDDHRLENLRMLCPNCHSQTETYRGRNKKLRKQKSLNQTEEGKALG
jgi:5-methylcytosine-specific restriction endonuclease McrA